MIKCQLINAEGKMEIGHDHPATGTAVVDSSRRRRWALKPWSGVSVRNRAVAHKSHQKTSVNFQGESGDFMLIKQSRQGDRGYHAHWWKEVT